MRLIRRLVAFLERVLVALGVLRPDPPSRLSTFEVTVTMSKSLTIAATVLALTPRQRSVAFVRVLMRAVQTPAADFVEINRMPIDPTTLQGSIETDPIAAGQYEFQGIAVDVDGRESSPPNAASATIEPDEEVIDPPSPLASFTVTVNPE